MMPNNLMDISNTGDFGVPDKRYLSIFINIAQF